VCTDSRSFDSAECNSTCTNLSSKEHVQSFSCSLIELKLCSMQTGGSSVDECANICAMHFLSNLMATFLYQMVCQRTSLFWEQRTIVTASHSSWEKRVDLGSTEGRTILWTAPALHQNLVLFFPRDAEVIYRSRYSDWLRDGRPRGRSSIPGGVKNFLFPTSSRLALGPTRPSIQ
jgi:hypothetical protein